MASASLNQATAASRTITAQTTGMVSASMIHAITAYRATIA